MGRIYIFVTFCILILLTSSLKVGSEDVALRGKKERLVSEEAASRDLEIEVGSACPNIEENVDYPGNDLNVGGMYGRVKGHLASVQECRTHCTQNPGCVGYTFVKTEPSGQDNCALKASWNEHSKNYSGCCDSQRITSACGGQCSEVDENVDYPGNDLHVGGMYGRVPGHLANADACRAECLKYTNCVGYTFVKSEPSGRDNCALKSSWDEGKRTYSGCCDSQRIDHDLCQPSSGNGNGNVISGGYWAQQAQVEPIAGFTYKWTNTLTNEKSQTISESREESFTSNFEVTAGFEFCGTTNSGAMPGGGVSACASVDSTEGTSETWATTTETSATDTSGNIASVECSATPKCDGDCWIFVWHNYKRYPDGSGEILKSCYSDIIETYGNVPQCLPGHCDNSNDCQTCYGMPKMTTANEAAVGVMTENDVGVVNEVSYFEQLSFETRVLVLVGLVASGVGLVFLLPTRKKSPESYALLEKINEEI